MSAIGFAVRKFRVVVVRGTFGAADGTLWRNDGLLRVTGSVAATDLHTGNARRDAHLVGADFLDAERHPRVGLEVSAFPLEANRAAGTLRIKGIETDVALAVRAEAGAGLVRVRATGVMDRRAAGIVPPGRWDRVIAGAVHLDLAVTFVPRGRLG